MTAEQAATLKVNQPVRCEADRGDPAKTVHVKYVSTDVQTNFHGVKFLWVTMKQGGVWPSNRLSFH